MTLKDIFESWFSQSELANWDDYPRDLARRLQEKTAELSGFLAPGWRLELQGQPFIVLGSGLPVRPGEGGKFQKRDPGGLWVDLTRKDLQNLSANDLHVLQRLRSPFREVVGLRAMQTELPPALEQFKQEYQTQLQALRAADSRGAMDGALEKARAFYGAQRSVLPSSARQEFLQAKQQMLQAGFARASSASEAEHFRNASRDFFRRHREAKENVPQHWEEEFMQEDHRKEFQGRLDAMHNAATFDELDRARKEIEALIRKHGDHLGPDARGKVAATFDSVWQGNFPPALPARLQATRANEEGISLTWDKAGGAGQYLIYRGDSAAMENRSLLCAIEAAAAPAPGLLDTAAEPGLDYFYWVTTKNGKAESDYVGPASGRRKEKAGPLPETQPPPDALSAALKFASQGDVAGILGLYVAHTPHADTWLGLLEPAWRKMSRDLLAALDSISLEDLAARLSFHEALDRKLEYLLQHDPQRIPKISEYRSRNSQLSERLEARKGMLLAQRETSQVLLKARDLADEGNITAMQSLMSRFPQLQEKLQPLLEEARQVANDIKDDQETRQTLIHMAETVVTRGDVARVEEMFSQLRERLLADPTFNQQLQKLLEDAKARVQKEESKSKAPEEMPKPAQEPPKLADLARHKRLTRRVAVGSVVALFALAAVAAVVWWNTKQSLVATAKSLAQKGDADAITRLETDHPLFKSQLEPALDEARKRADELEAGARVLADDLGVEEIDKRIQDHPFLAARLGVVRQAAVNKREAVLAQARSAAEAADTNKINQLQKEYPGFLDLKNLASQAGDKVSSVLTQAKSLADQGDEKGLADLVKNYPILQPLLAPEQARAKVVTTAARDAAVVKQAGQLAAQASVSDIEKLIQEHPGLESSLRPLRQQAQSRRDGVLAQARELAGQADTEGIKALQTNFPQLEELATLTNQAAQKAASVLAEAKSLADRGQEKEIASLEAQYPKLQSLLSPEQARAREVAAVVEQTGQLAAQGAVSNIDKLMQEHPALESSLKPLRQQAEVLRDNIMAQARALAAQADAAGIKDLQAKHPRLPDLESLTLEADKKAGSILAEADSLAQQGKDAEIMALEKQFPVLSPQLAPARKKASDALLTRADEFATHAQVSDIDKLMQDNPQLQSELSLRKTKAESLRNSVWQLATNLAARIDLEALSKLQNAYPSLAELKDLQSKTSHNAEVFTELASKYANEADVAGVERIIKGAPALAPRLEPFRQQAVNKRNEILAQAANKARQMSSALPHPSPVLDPTKWKYTNGGSMTFTWAQASGQWHGGYVTDQEVTVGQFFYAVDGIHMTTPEASRPDTNRPVWRAADSCASLTVLEGKIGNLPAGWKYRLPSFEEWKALESTPLPNPLWPSKVNAVLVTGSRTGAAFATITKEGISTAKIGTSLLGPHQGFKIVLVRER